jgi:hypothetical protein
VADTLACGREVILFESAGVGRSVAQQIALGRPARPQDAAGGHRPGGRGGHHVLGEAGAQARSSRTLASPAILHAQRIEPAVRPGPSWRGSPAGPRTESRSRARRSRKARWPPFAPGSAATANVSGCSAASRSDASARPLLLAPGGSTSDAIGPAGLCEFAADLLTTHLRATLFRDAPRRSDTNVTQGRLCATKARKGGRGPN